ncbi:S1 RNA-binding domain-containing protein [Streptomyces tauricus]|uniref:S1 RNA-binding domain-containing protein n=1 Tax=Streptomyces tauricus TaxID=68274 RepID=UPI002AD1F089|nr:S1 RNA-binding domain-containing protein [Streptomyces tauricus]
MSGRVTKLVPFGVFVQVADGIEGLVHLSETRVDAGGDSRGGRSGRRTGLGRSHVNRCGATAGPYDSPFGPSTT